MKTTYEANQLKDISGARVAIIQSEWYREYSDIMVSRCKTELAKAGCKDIIYHQVPGALELPLACRHLIRTSGSFDAVIVFGILLKGETLHFEMIFEIATRGFERVMFEEDTPIIIELLPVTNIEQVIARCSNNDSNKGIEAAIAASKIISWKNSLV